MNQYFFITTFGSIYNKALPLIEEKKSEGKVFVVTANINVKNFFENYTEYDILYIPINSNIISRKKWYLTLLEVIKMNYYYKKYFSDVSNSSIYFFGSSWTIALFNYIQKLSKKNKIYQYLSDQEPTNWKYVTSMKARILQILVKILTNVDVDVITNMGLLSFDISKKFYSKNKINVVNKESSKEPLLKYMNKFTFDEKILVVTEDVIKYNRVEKEEYISKMSLLVGILNKNFDGKYKVKAHPNEPRTYNLFPDSTIIPHYIPSEFLMRNKWKYIIGLESLTLIKATQLTNAKVVSLIDFIEYKEHTVAKMFKEWQHKGSSKIVFPKNKQELEKILS